MKKREILKYVLILALIVALLSSTYLGIRTNESLQACLKKNRRGSSSMSLHFWLSIGRATDIKYLLRTYREGLGETELNEDNVEAVIDGFFYEMEYAYWFLRGLKALNPELDEYEKPIYFIDRLILYRFVLWERVGRRSIRPVLSDLNGSILLTAFKELNQTSFHKIDEFGREVAESFAPFNATRLDNTVNIVEELETVLVQWINKYSEEVKT